jgi:hypothetical protein
MTGRDEFASLTPYFFRGYYDYRRHRASLGISWEFKDRLQLSAMAEAWVRHFDVYEARTADNFWTGELRLDTEIEASIEAAVRVATIRGKYRKHDFFISLLGAHVTRDSNMTARGLAGDQLRHHPRVPRLRGARPLRRRIGRRLRWPSGGRRRLARELRRTFVHHCGVSQEAQL